MALYLLERDKPAAERLAQTLLEAVAKVNRCQYCRMLTEETVCRICSGSRRNKQIVCVVESPADLYAIEQAGGFLGIYFVLYGHLSPIDGVGPDVLGIPQLLDQLQKNQVEELILATNLTLEGETTAHFIGDKVRALNVKVSRIAYGVPMGGELEYVDGGTLNLALESRKSL
tara:strand:+ start:989 stop:1504 length:516 start_codon:yes stop_codon:yes gene_type:complete